MSSKFRYNGQEIFLASPIASENICCDSFHFHLLDKMGLTETIKIKKIRDFKIDFERKSLG